jgi:hypothetical protein
LNDYYQQKSLKVVSEHVFAHLSSFLQVGAEKEMNFLDLFKEVSFLLSEDIKVSFQVLVGWIIWFIFVAV